jgi:hypothetical protein
VSLNSFHDCTRLPLQRKDLPLFLTNNVILSPEGSLMRESHTLLSSVKTAKWSFAKIIDFLKATCSFEFNKR